MTMIRFSSEQLVAQIMVPFNRLLRDVNALLETEIAQQELDEENAINDMQPMPDQGSATGQGPVMKWGSATDRGSATGSMEMPARPGVETGVSQAGAHPIELERGEIAKQDMSEQLKLAARPGGLHKNPAEQVERLAMPAGKMNEYASASPLTQKIDASGISNDGINVETPPSLTLTQTKAKPETPHNAAHEFSPATRLPKRAAPSSVPGSTPAAALPVHSLDQKNQRAPFSAAPHRGPPGGSVVESMPVEQPNDNAGYGLVAQDHPKTSNLSTRIPLRPCATQGDASVAGMAGEISSHPGRKTITTHTTEPDTISSQAAAAPRSIQRQGNRIIQGVDPVLEHAHQMTHAALTRDALDDETDLAASRVQNTFNVSVSMNQDAASASLDREVLKDTLLEMLRTAARRQGLEI